MDKVSTDRANMAHPRVQKDLHDILLEAESVLASKWKLRYTWTLRTMAQQNDLYAQGRTRPGRVVTWAKGGESWHNYGLAVDICLVDEVGKMASFDTKADFDGDAKADWLEVVALFKKRGWEWGGDWPIEKRDMPHFQKTFGLSIAQAKKKVRPNERYIDL